MIYNERYKLRYKQKTPLKLIWDNQMGKPGINGLLIKKLNYCLLFQFDLLSAALIFSLYTC